MAVQVELPEGVESGDAVERAYAALRRKIFRGELAPGSRLTEADLGSMLQMSRTPVRAALVRLQAEGLIQRSTKRGAVVTHNAVSILSDLFRIRENLELRLCVLAVERLTAQNADELDALIDDFDQAVAEDNAASAVSQRSGEHERTFHQKLAAIVARPRIATMLVDLDELIQERHPTPSTRLLERHASQHRELIEAFRARDAEWAMSAMSSHLRSVESVADDPQVTRDVPRPSAP